MRGPLDGDAVYQPLGQKVERPAAPPVPPPPQWKPTDRPWIERNAEGKLRNVAPEPPKFTFGSDSAQACSLGAVGLQPHLEAFMWELVRNAEIMHRKKLDEFLRIGP